MQLHELGANIVNPADNEDLQKFFALEEEKRERIINAALKGFSAGYKAASTDSIVREAGISKGLLFFHFGTKERLYGFLIDHAIETVRREYISLMNVEHADILENMWQMSLLKRDLSQRFPAIFDFLAAAYLDETVQNEEIKTKLAYFKQIQAHVMSVALAHTDHALFRDDMAPEMIIKLINWVVTGYQQSKVAEFAGRENNEVLARENYDAFLNEFDEILSALRRCLYKKEDLT